MVAGSPTLIYDERDTFALEEAFAKQQTKLPAKLYLLVAELEEVIDDTPITDTLRMVTILQSRKYKGLTVIKHIFAGQNHCEVATPGI